MTEVGSELDQHKLRFSGNFKLLVATGTISRTGLAGFQISVLWIALLITRSSILAGLADGMAVLPLKKLRSGKNLFLVQPLKKLRKQ